MPQLSRFLPLLFAFAIAFPSCSKPDEQIIETHELEFHIVNSDLRADNIVWLDQFHALRLRYDLLSFTSNGGSAWSTEWSASSNRDVRTMVYPQVDTAYAFTQDVSDVDVYRTIDRGVTWTLLYTIQTGPNCSASASARSSKKIFCITEVASNSYKVYKTTNAGITWTAGNTCPQLYSFTAITDSLFFGLSNSMDLYRSTQAGLNFAPVTVGLDVAEYVILPSLQKGFLVDHSGVIYGSNDFGASWQQILNDPGNSNAFHIDAHISGLVVAAGNGAPLISRDFGATWDYYILKGVPNMIDYRFNSIKIMNANTFVCSVRDPNNGDYQLITCTLP